jgi:hypothetical protein
VTTKFKHTWTTEEEDSLCDLVTATTDMMQEVKRRTGMVEDYWTMIAGILWQHDGIHTSGEGCRKRFAESKDRFFLDMKERMEREAAATAAQESRASELSKWDELYAKIRCVEEMDDREIAEDLHRKIERIEESCDVMEEAMLTICRELGVKLRERPEATIGPLDGRKPE